MSGTSTVALVSGLIGMATGIASAAATFLAVASDRRSERLLMAHELGWRFEDEYQSLLPELWEQIPTQDADSELKAPARGVWNRLFSLQSRAFRAAGDGLLRDVDGDWNGLRAEFRYWLKFPQAQPAVEELVNQQRNGWPVGFADFIAAERRAATN